MAVHAKLSWIAWEYILGGHFALDLSHRVGSVRSVKGSRASLFCGAECW
jgi:hypothetical protein